MSGKKTGRIETRSSRTAGFTCLSRAASYKDRRECYTGSDYIAYILIPEFFKLLLKSRLLFGLFRKIFFPRGIYEYVIARTKYFDDVFREALEKDFDQIVIFGAGFDSRALRFNKLNKHTHIFELDAPLTQQEKIKAYKAKSLIIPENLAFVPVNFNTDSLEEKIIGGGFAAGKKCLFLLEGVTMYLSREGIDSTFRFIADFCGEGSLIVFDYIYADVLRKEDRNYGERDIYITTASVGEEWKYGIERDKVEQLLESYGFHQKENCGAPELEYRYFRNSNGIITGRINGTHAIVTGIKS